MDIEEIAVLAVKNEIIKYSDLVAYIDSKDKMPIWDGNIFIYKSNSEHKKNNEFLGKVQVQVKGKKVKKLSNGNSKFKIEVDYLRAYQREKNGTLLLVVEIVDYANTKLYYANLLPVDLEEILKKVKDDQKTVTISIKPIKEKSASSFKMICLNFLKNSKLQMNIEIKNIDELKNIEKISFSITGDREYIEEYLFDNDVYTYGIESKTGKIYALPKLQNIERMEKNNVKVSINDKEYYQQTVAIKNKNERYVLCGKSIKIDFDNKKVSFKVQGNVYERINDINFIIDLLEHEELCVNNEKIAIPLKIDKDFKAEYISTLKVDLSKLIKIRDVFEKFGINFKKDIDKLDKRSLNRLDGFIKLNDGVLMENIKKSNMYWIDISDIRIAFLVIIDKNGKLNIYNHFGDLSNLIRVFYINRDNQQVTISPYINLTAENLISFSNINIDVMKKTFEAEFYSDETCERYNLWMLEVIKAYDMSKDKKWLYFAYYINTQIMKFSQNNSYIINKMQILKRFRELNLEEKDKLYEIRNIENSNDMQCAIAILLDNQSDFERYFNRLSDEEKENFKKYPIYNIANI